MLRRLGAYGIACVAFPGLLTGCNSARDCDMTDLTSDGKLNDCFIENDRIRVGVDLNIGGAITHVSSKTGGENMINSWDWGRQIQMSFYSGPPNYQRPGKVKADVWGSFPWNPVQSGDHFGSPSIVLEHKRSGNEIYVKSRPMLWPMKDDAAECIFETWITLEGSAFHFRGRLSNQRTDTTAYGAYPQELPAVYTNGEWHRLMTYVGADPFTNAALTEVRKSVNEPWPWTKWLPSEGWAALIDDSGTGIGVWSPAGQFDGGFVGERGKGGPKDGSTGYMAPTQSEILDHNIVYDYRATFIVGTLNEIRGWVCSRAEKNLPQWNFAADRQHFTFENALDNGWPIQDGLRLKLSDKTSCVNSPFLFWKADQAPKLRIRAAFKTSGSILRIRWREYNSRIFTSDAWAQWQREWWNDERSATFNIKNDGTEEEYVIDLSAHRAYAGALSGIRLELPSSKAGDEVSVKSIALIS